jgi:phage repressor protein C with HTH and peptisase S24 domain
MVEDFWKNRELFRQWVEDAKVKARVTTLQEVSIAIGAGRTTLVKYVQTNESQLHKPGIELLKKLGDFLERDYRLLLDQPENQVPWLDPTNRSYNLITNQVPIPKLSLNLCAGDGIPVYENDEVTIGTITFNEHWIRNKLNAMPEKLRIHDIEGDSMEPTLNDGDLVLVDLGAPDRYKDGLWVVRLNDVVHVKRVQHMPNNQFQASSDNTVYRPFFLDDSSQLIGRVVWTSRTL